MQNYPLKYFKNVSLLKTAWSLAVISSRILQRDLSLGFPSQGNSVVEKLRWIVSSEAIMRVGDI